jgi:hypothetical protein
LQIRKEVLDEERIRTVPPRALEFLEDHAMWTVRVLRLEDVQRFISTMTGREGMREESTPEVIVMVLPYPHENAEAPIAHGSYLPGLRQIWIYPGLASNKELEGMTDPEVRRFQEVVAGGDGGIRFAQRHILTVIHEILHIKYGHDELPVEEKSQEHMSQFFPWLKSGTMPPHVS